MTVLDKAKNRKMLGFISQVLCRLGAAADLISFLDFNFRHWNQIKINFEDATSSQNKFMLVEFL